MLLCCRKTGGKLTSHLLSAHGGEIFIHTLQVSRCCLDDLPSILEGAGGKVTDYRITDFASLIQRHKLLPLKTNIECGPDHNMQKARTTLAKNTKYWPITFSNTIIYNVRQVRACTMQTYFVFFSFMLTLDVSLTVLRTNISATLQRRTH